MRTILGRVVNGKIDVSDSDLPEGEVVAIVARAGEGVELTPEEEDELSAAMAEADAGQWTDGSELLRDLRELSRR